MGTWRGVGCVAATAGSSSADVSVDESPQRLCFAFLCLGTHNTCLCEMMFGVEETDLFLGFLFPLLLYLLLSEIYVFVLLQEKTLY